MTMREAMARDEAARLAEVNARMKPRNIKGKEYIEVNQRILGFWELYPDGRIVTTKTHDDGDRCDFRAEVYVGDVLKATGHAYELKSASMVNKTSYVENCETSAVGRALGMLGIGSTESIASAEEVEAAIAQQEASAKPVKSPEKPAAKSNASKLDKAMNEAMRAAAEAVETERAALVETFKRYKLALAGRGAEVTNDEIVAMVEKHVGKPRSEWAAPDYAAAREHLELQIGGYE